MSMARLHAVFMRWKRRRETINAMADNAQPIVRWNSLNREWVCSDRTACYAYAWGDTPEEAYRRWREKFVAWAEGVIQ